MHIPLKWSIRVWYGYILGLTAHVGKYQSACFTNFIQANCAELPVINSTPACVLAMLAMCQRHNSVLQCILSCAADYPLKTCAACVCSAVNSARAPTAGEKLLQTAWSCVLCPMKHETHIFSAPGFDGSLQLSISHVPSVLPNLLCKSSEGSIKAQNYQCN